MITNKIKNKNGNYLYFLYPDGTKIRQFKKVYNPEYPETLDMKITNFCDSRCKWCHEKSSVRGKYCTWNLDILDGLPEGVEIAIGGGNPLSHPKIFKIVDDINSKGLIPNITVNTFHLIQEKYQKILNKLNYTSLGISFSKDFKKIPKRFINENTVWHFINGVHSLDDMRVVAKYNKGSKALILGYKSFGRGVNFIPKYKYSLKELKKLNYKVIAFDNLAVDQFKIVDENYMGEDGNFSFYVDLVNKEFGKGSYDPIRYKMIKNIKNSFEQIKILSTLSVF